MVSLFRAESSNSVSLLFDATQEFLTVYPDKLGSQLRNLLRVPLWQRGKRAIARRKAGLDDVGDESSTWWTEEWVQSLVSRSDDSSSSASSPSLGDYPIVCRVERTHAEFPPDPYDKEKSVTKTGEETTISWTAKASETVNATTKMKRKRKVQVRLAILLKPFTTILPDELNGSDDKGALDRNHDNDTVRGGRCSSCSRLDLPPNFTVLIAPLESPLEPFIVPFCWAYSTFHSLSIGDPVWILNAVNHDYRLDNSETKKAGRCPPNSGKGKITSFLRGPVVGTNVGSQGGNCESEISLRLHDKVDLLEELLSRLIRTGTSLEQQVEAILLAETSQRKLPIRETCILVEFLSSYLEIARGKAKETQKVNLPRGTTSLIALIHRTLPCRHSVVVAFDSNRRQMKKSSSWSIIPLQPNAIARNLDHGFLNNIESSWREKAILCIEDLIENSSVAELFFREVTEKEAPSYYCAVPVAMVSVTIGWCRVICSIGF